MRRRRPDGAMFRAPALALADAQVSAGGTAYVYLFEWPSPMAGGTLGSCHALELPFVFNTLDVIGPNTLVGQSPPSQIGTSMNATWASFARSGAPTGPWGAWSAYDNERSTMVINDSSELVRDPRSAERQLWST